MQNWTQASKPEPLKQDTQEAKIKIKIHLYSTKNKHKQNIKQNLNYKELIK